MITEGLLERVEPDSAGAEQALNEATLHASSADLISGSDPHGAFQLAYDAARKSVGANLRRAGLRVRKGEGGHQITAAYASAAIDRELGERLERMRRRRNRSEYGSEYFSADEVSDAVELARRLIDAVG